MVKLLPTFKTPMEKFASGLALLLIGVLAAFGVKALIDFLESSIENFKDGAAIVTYYFMEGCPHCKDMKPKWDKFKALAAKSKEEIVTKEMSADEDYDDISKVEPKVAGFPTIHVEWKGKTVEYRGPREEGALMEFVKNTMSS